MKIYDLPKLALLALTILSALTACNNGPTLIDISPDDSNLTTVPRISPSGLIVGIATGNSHLYAVSPDAGIWTSVKGPNNSWGTWYQAQTSPRYSSCIALDPADELHFAVGERDGDAIQNSDNHCGVWESFDGGVTFPTQYYFDPSSGSASGQGEQVVEGITFSSQRTLFIATPYGVARKTLGGTFDYSHSPTRNEITAISSFDDRVVARNEDSLYISKNDGSTWDTIPIPDTVDGLVRSFDTVRGDLYTVAGVKPTPSGNFFVYLPFFRVPRVDNLDYLMIYDETKKAWHSQQLTYGNGTGLGGRRLVKSFKTANPAIAPQIGAGYVLMYGVGQQMLNAYFIDANGIPLWNQTLQTTWGGPYGTLAPQNIHADLWDYGMSPDFSAAFVSCDGGVYFRTGDIDWTSLISGLHTHTIHAAVIADGVVAYATTDNDCWYSWKNHWAYQNTEGDANWVANDAGNNQYMVGARHLLDAGFTNFPLAIPTSPDTLNTDLTYDPESFQFIQTLASESYTFLDAVMLVNLPLKYFQNGVLTNVPGLLGNPPANRNPVLIRNGTYETMPNINLWKGVGWSGFYNDLPAGVSRFWLSGGHTTPTVFVYASQKGVGQLFRRAPKGSTWVPLNVANVLPPAEYGPLFVNPYNPKVVYVMTTTGVVVSADSGNTFNPDTQLTDLISGSGKYPINRNFSGGNGSHVPQSMESHANWMCPLSCMGFDRADPTKIVASSPFTGIFYKNGSADWVDYSAYLLRPYSPVSTVAIDDKDIYFGMEGRGMMRMYGY